MATAQQPIIDAVFAALTASTGNGTFYSAVAGRIYDTFAPDDPTLPFSVFTIVSDPTQGYFTNDGIQVDFQLDVFGEIVSATGGPKAARAIGDLGYALLHRQPITITGYAGCSMLCTARTPGLELEIIAGGRTQEDAFRDSRTYRLFGTGTA